MTRIVRSTVFCLLRQAILFAALAVLAAPAQAQSWNFGLTAYDQQPHSAQAELLVERSFRSFGSLGRWAFAPALAFRAGGDSTWVGGGLIATRPFGQGQWQLEAGVMPGYYDANTDAADLGSEVEFRSFVSLDRRVSDRAYVGLAAEHMSNADIGRKNPGDNRVMLRIVLLDRP